jgi:anthranilate phosphoribosyltransferase
MSMKQYLEKCLAGSHLSQGEAAGALELIMTNQATESQIAGLLIALRAKGESIDEIVGFARTMRAHSVKIRVDDPKTIDMCGTGGDGLSTFNISTVASLVVSGAGVTVAKHGNRSVSSLSGSADLLVAMGVNIQMAPGDVEACINTVGFGFLFAPLFHPAMKYASKPRTELGVRTIFNMLGPITNPAEVRNQLIGTYQSGVASHLAGALAQLETDHTCVVHAENGMDEVTLSGGTRVFEINGDRRTRKYDVSAADFGLKDHPVEALRGGNSKENAEIALRVLHGEASPARDVVVANAAFGLYVAGKARDLMEGTVMAAESIDSGKALNKLKRLVEITNR